MLAMTCDLCGMAVAEKAHLIDIIEARMVMSADSRPRMSERGRITSVEACELCGLRVLRLMESIRQKKTERDQTIRALSS